MVNKPSDHLERTFDHDLSHKNLDHSKFISLTEANLPRNKNIVAKYQSKHSLQSTAGVLERKRMSTEQLEEVSPESSTPDNITDNSDSFKSSSTIVNRVYDMSKRHDSAHGFAQARLVTPLGSPKQNVNEERTTEKNGFMKRTQSRRESRILIQPLPRLFTQSKYNDFRLAKSSERTECASSRRQLVIQTSNYQSPKNNVSESVGFNSDCKESAKRSQATSIRSPTGTP